MTLGTLLGVVKMRLLPLECILETVPQGVAKAATLMLYATEYPHTHHNCACLPIFIEP